MTATGNQNGRIQADLRDESDLAPVGSADSLPSPPPANRQSGKASGLMLLAALGLAIVVPQVLKNSGTSQQAPVPKAVAQQQPAKIADPLPPVAPPSDQEIGGVLNDLIKTAQNDWDKGILIRADRYMEQARKSDNAEIWLWEQYRRFTAEYKREAEKRGNFDGSPEDQSVIRDKLAESLAILVAIRRIRDGKAVSGEAIAPSGYLDQAVTFLQQYSLKLNIRLDEAKNDARNQSVPTQGDRKPTVGNNGGKPPGSK